MDCQTLKAGTDCIFMTKDGCSFNGGKCHPIIEACEGCAKIVEFTSGKYCSASPDPQAKWIRGFCNLATHIKNGTKIEAEKINPLKASKRAAKRAGMAAS